MSNDISTEYTKSKNKEEGRRGYLMWKRKKETVIIFSTSPKNYGMFLQEKKRRKK